MNTDEFRRLGHELIEWVAAYRERLETLPVMSPVSPGDIRRRFPARPPVEGGRLADAVAALDRDIVPGITHWNHPGFFAYFPANTSLASVLADLVASGLGAQGMSWQTSPAATELEEVVLDWLRQMVGLSEAWTGVIQDTASTVTLVALLCARERASAFAQERGGLQAGGPPMVVYASREAHSSVAKAALLAGFGREHVRTVDTDEKHALDPAALERAIAADAAAGRRPAAVVATVGSTASTAIDPVARVAELAARHGMWVHVDAALAGNAMILPECRHLWAGIEGADSVVWNPHKWLGPGFDLSVYYVRDPALLTRVMSTSPSYLRTAQDGTVKNYRDWHIQLGRRFRALKLWFVLMDQGVSGLQARLRRDLENARWLERRVADSAGWELLAPVPLQTVCLRHVPPALRGDEEALARHNLEITRRVNAGGGAYLTPAVLAGKQAVRVTIGAEATERRHVEALWKAIEEAAT